MIHLTPEQFVDIADGVLAESGSEVAPHLATCVECRQQLADMRAVMTEVADVESPAPSPLFWDQLSARVRDAVAEESPRRSWRVWLLQPRVLVPSCVSVLAVALIAVVLPRPVLVPLAPAPPPSMLTTSVTAPPRGADSASLPSFEPSLPPLGAADDPQLGLVADFGTTLDWDEMRDEIALGGPGTPGTSSDAVVGALTVDEQRELQRLLAHEMTQAGVPENRS